MKSLLSSFLEFVKIAVFALLLVIPLRMYVFQPFLVRGASMEPNFHNGDYLVVDEISYRFGEPERGEVIVFRFPENPDQRFIKRIIGLPGETVEVKAGRVMVYNTQEGEDAIILDEIGYLPSSTRTPGSVHTTLEEDEYFVLGDNRSASSDSRVWGVLPEENIVGRVFVRLLPPEAFAKVEAPNY